jgi:aldehyde:ferredoxin oxidoreductase
MIDDEAFRVLVIDLAEQKGQVIDFGDPKELLGGSGLAAALFDAYGDVSAPANDPGQPLIFTIGPLTAFFPLMSKVVLGFKSPYHEQYAETHAGGRLAMAMRFAGYDALVIKGVARTPSCLIVGGTTIEIKDVHYLWGLDVLATGKWLRRIHRSDSGHRSILRIGPAGEKQVAYASINVDTYRHFGRLGAGAIMGSKNLKGMIVLGDGSLTLPKGKAYSSLYKDMYEIMTRSKAMRKYHDLGTPENLLPLNEMQAIPWRNLQATSDDGIHGISGERFADELLLRKTACSGCPVGCIHVGLLRERFATEHEFLYRQVSYDYEPIFAAGSMLGITQAEQVLMLLEEIERQGVDVMSAGVAIAWATEALEKGLVTEKETLVGLRFGHADGYDQAIRHLGAQTNEFYQVLGQGTAVAAAQYGGEDFACVLGQEMAGYVTGEVFLVSQAYGFRHSHLDNAGYGFDQKHEDKDVTEAVRYLMEEETRRVQLTCMVSCLFARSVYTEERLQEALASLGYKQTADSLPEQARAVQAKRWQLKFQSGYNPANVPIPKRLKEIRNWKGPVDDAFLKELSARYQQAITRMAGSEMDAGRQSP